MTALEHLNDREFADLLKEAIWNNSLFSPFERPENVDRSLEALVTLKASIQGQLAQYGKAPETNPDWARRAKRYLIQTESRHSQIRRLIKALNREETAEMAVIERKWSAFAFELAEALEVSDSGHALDNITKSENLTAREWLARRREIVAKRAEKAADQRITIQHEGGNTITGTPEDVLNHGHLKGGWRAV